MINNKSIMVIGDIMLDTYFIGDVKRISPEAPVPIFKKKNERSALGGAANVAANLVAAGQTVYIQAMVGKDNAGNKIKDELLSKGINTDYVVSLDRQTTEKIRFLASNNQQVLRLDIEDTSSPSDKEYSAMIKSFENKIEEIDLVIMSDYLKGLFTYEFTQSIIKIAKENNVPLIIDVKDKQYNKYKNATLLKPNMKELCDLTSMTIETDEEIVSASEELRTKCNCQYVLTTCGDRGMVLVGDGEPYFIEAFGQEVFDVTGAGDTTIAYLGACMVNGYSMRESVDIANLAAGIQVSKVGTSSVYWKEIKDRIDKKYGRGKNKIISGHLIDSFRQNNINKKIVFTNGCFDILHIGHIRYLQEASKLGDLLVVGLNSDSSVRRLKGEGRPINNEAERAEMLAALDFIDNLIIFEEDTPLNLIRKIQPDVLVKGGDYLEKEVVGKSEVEERGGKVVLIPFVDGKSTTNIIDKIKK